MSNDTFKLVEIVGTSKESVDDAIKSGIARAQKTLRDIGWFQVSEIRGGVGDGGIAEFQVVMKVGLKLE